MKKHTIVVIMLCNVGLLIFSILCLYFTAQNNKSINSIENDFSYRKEGNAVVVRLCDGEELTLIFEKTAVKIKESYRIKSRDKQLCVIAFICEYAKENGCEFQRSRTELWGELRLHNMAYELGIKRESTADADLEYEADKRCYVNVVSKIIGWTGL